MKKTILAMSAVITAALFFACSQPETPPANNSGSDSGTSPTTGTPGSTTGTSGGSTPGANPGTTIVPPTSFTAPALPASEGSNIFAGKSFTTGSSTWTFNADGTFTQTHTGGSSSAPYTYTESYRYSYNATSNILSTIPTTIVIWSNGSNQSPTVLNYQQAYNYFSSQTIESLLQSIPGNTTEAKIQFLISQLSPEDIALLNLPQNASNTQILQAYVDYGTRETLKQFSTITKYIVTVPNESNSSEYRLTEYYDQDYMAGKYYGYIQSESVYYYEKYTKHNNKVYNLLYNNSSNNNSTSKYYKLNSLATGTSGTITATNVDNASDTLTINYTRSWSNGVNTFTFSFTMDDQQKNFTLTNPSTTLTESTGTGSTTGGTSGGSTDGTTTSGGTGTGTTDGTGGTTTSGGSGAGTTTGGTTDTSGTGTGGTTDGGSSETGISITLTPPESFTPPALPTSEGSNIFAGKTLTSDTRTWTFNADGTFTQTWTGGSSSGNPYSYTESYRYSYNATSHILSTSRTTIAIWSNNNQGGPEVMNYQQAYNYFSAITVESFLQSVPGNTTEEKMQTLVSQIAPEDIALLNLPENASNAQILQAYLGYSTQNLLNQYSTITKYKVSTNTYTSSTEYLLTDYYDQDYIGGVYVGCYSPANGNGPYEYLYYHENRTSHNNKRYNIEYKNYVNGSSTQSKFYKLNTLATEASGTITATNVDNASDTLSISYTRSWEDGINTFNFIITIDGQAKTFILTNHNTTLTENTGTGGTTGGSTPIISGSSITPPASFTPPALPASAGTDPLAGKTYATWTFNNDGTFTQRKTGSNNGGHYEWTENYRYSYNATNNVLSTIPVTIAVWENNNQGGPTVMTYEQAYNSYSAMTVESALQSVPGDTLEAKAQTAVTMLASEDIALLNLPQNASPIQIIQAYLNLFARNFLNRYSTITKYKYSETTTGSGREYQFTEYYDQDYRAGRYSGSISAEGRNEYLSYNETPSTRNRNTYYLQYSISNIDSSDSTDKYYNFNTLPTAASGTITATNIENESDTLSISYTRNWADGINTFTFSFTVDGQQKSFTLTNITVLSGTLSNN